MKLYLIVMASLASSLIFLGCKANVYGAHKTRGQYEGSQVNLLYEAQGRVGITKKNR